MTHSLGEYNCKACGRLVRVPFEIGPLRLSLISKLCDDCENILLINENSLADKILANVYKIRKNRQLIEWDISGNNERK